MKLLLSLFFCLSTLPVFAANPAFGDFTNSQFGVGGNKVTLQTNWVWATASGVVDGRATNTHGALAYGYSANLGNLVNTFKVITNNTRSLRILIGGDSTGADMLPYFYSLFSTNYISGVHPSPEFGGTSSYFSVPNVNGFGQIGQNVIPGLGWWGQCFAISNGVGIACTFGIANSLSIAGNQIRFWYQGTNTTGTAVIYTSPSVSSNTWTAVGTVDSTTGPSGLRCTNIALAAVTNVYLKISNSVAGTEGRFLFIWPQIRDTTAKYAEFGDYHVGGQTLHEFLGMGTNGIATLLTNFAPDLIIYQQKKSVASMNDWTNVAPLIRYYATNADMIIVQSYPSGDPTFEPDPTQGCQFQLVPQRDVALSNNWVFIDLVTPFPWTNVIERFNLNADAIHLNSVGQMVAGGMVSRQLGLYSMMADNGKLRIGATLGANSFSGSQTVTGNVYTVGAAAGFRFSYRPTSSTYLEWLYDAPSGNGTAFLDQAGLHILSMHIPFGDNFSLNFNSAGWSGVGATLGDTFPWQLYGTNSSFNGQFTNSASFQYSNSWLTATNTRKTNLGRRGTWEADFTFTDAVGGYPALKITVEDLAGTVTNTWTCQIPAGLAATSTNHYSFRVAPSGVVSVTNISTSTATADIVRSSMTWE